MKARKFDLIGFDVDGTLVEHPSGRVIWEVLNLRFVGNDDVNMERKRMYDAGEITYEDWVSLDVSGWIGKGATRGDILETVGEFRLVDGAFETVSELKTRGYRLALISGSLDIVIRTLFPHCLFDDVYSNKLYFDEEGKLTGWEATPFDLHGKPEAIKAIAKKHGTSLERTAFVGDGDNDVSLIGVVEYFIAFNPHSHELERKADLVIKDASLIKLLDIFL